ncbi:MAG: hypothetical protein R2781_03660 [Flavobacteriaceae bacterium]
MNHFIDLLNQSDDGASELLLEMKNDESEELFRLYRYDLVTKKEDGHGITEFNTDGFLNHQDISYTVGNKTIILSPIVWNGVEISINDSFNGFDMVKKWAFKWLDINGDKEADSNNLQGVIHSMTKPESENNWTTFSIDFGSSPVETVMELLDILVNDPKTTIIKLESTWMTKNKN